MKKTLLTMLLSLLIPFAAMAQEAYAMYTSDGTLTFYYDNQKSSRSGTKYELNTGTNAPGWYTDHADDIKKAVFNSSFANARPTSTYQWFAATHVTKSSLTEIVGMQYLNTSNVTNMRRMFDYCNELTSLDLSKFNTSNVTDMYQMFHFCSRLKSLDVSKFNTSKVTTMEGMFCGCHELEELDVTNFDTRKVTDMSFMFSFCSGLTSLDVSKFNTSNVTYMYAMFEDCYKLTSLNLSNFNTANVTSMSAMFEDCSKLTSLNLSNFNTAKVYNMGAMFRGCSSLTSVYVSNFNTANVSSMDMMFRGCKNLTNIDVSNFNTSRVTDMSGMFNECSGLTTLDLSNFDTGNVKTMYSSIYKRGMFQDCTNLTIIYVGNGWNTDNVTASDNMFLNCTNLVGGAGTVYDVNHVDKEYAHIDGGTSNPGYLTGKNITPSLNLQEFINANAGATGVVEVDLSKFENDLTREQTLNVSTGASYRFINGTLSRSETLDAPVVYVSNGSKMEVGSGAIITSQGHLAADLQAQFKVEATIKLNKGSLSITSGKVEGSCGSRNHGNVMVMTIDEEDPAVELTSDNDTFLMTGGEMGGYFLCTAEKASVRFMGGEIYGHYYKKSTAAQGAPQANRATASHSYAPLINTRSNVYINKVKSYWGHRGMYTGNEDQNAFRVSLHGNNVVYLQSGGMDSFGFTVEDKKDGDLVMVGDNYTITANDMACMSVSPFRYYSESTGKYVEQECYLELKDNKVYLRYKTEELPTTGCDEEWLQNKLDEIAAQKPSEPVELTICEDGITLTRGMMVNRDCKVILTGGPLTSATTVTYPYGGEGVVMVYGELTFHDISLSFNNDAKNDGCTGYIWSGGGTVKLLSGTQITTKNGTVVGGWGQLDIKDATIQAGGREMMIASAINTTITDFVSMTGQQTYCNGKISVNGKKDPVTGTTQYPVIRVSEVHVTSSLDLMTPKNNQLTVYLHKDAVVNTYKDGFLRLPFAGEWGDMTIGRAFITSPSITQSDYNRISFIGMPTDRRAEFVPSSHQVRLTTASQQSIQSGLNLIANVDQNAPVVLYVNPETVNMVYQSATINHQNVTFDGMQSGSTSRGRMHFTKDQTITLAAGSRLTLTNIDVTGENGREGFVVNGKVIIGDNVHVSDLPCFLQVGSAGSVMVSGQLMTTVNIQFVNGIANGQTVVTGGDGYQMTDDDLEYIHVPECELQLDKPNNRVIAVNVTGIEVVAADTLSSTTSVAVYDLNGRRVTLPRQGVYILKKDGKTRKMYVK